MAVKEIVVADEATLAGDSDSVLRCKCRAVEGIDDYIEGVINDLTDTLHSDTLSVGLAAPQIGHDVSIAIVNLDKAQSDVDLVLINPVVVSESGQWDKKHESCMSVPHKRGEVKRRKKVTVKFRDRELREQELSTSGFEARVILHEIDHLNGILFTDRMEEGSNLEDTDLFRDHGVE